MGVAIHVGSATFEVGSASFLTSFFSTVYVRLEKNAWGSRFPTIMTQLYAGEVAPGSAASGLQELAVIQAELAELQPSRVVWDHEHPSQAPPWGSAVAPSIRNLAEYFITSAGQPLLDVLSAALGEAVRAKAPLRLS